jgi:hypothetical protein
VMHGREFVTGEHERDAAPWSADFASSSPFRMPLP